MDLNPAWIHNNSHLNPTYVKVWTLPRNICMNVKAPEILNTERTLEHLNQHNVRFYEEWVNQ